MSIIYINPFQFAAPPVGPTDPYFSNVSLLLHGDGTNGSTTIVDSSPSPKTVTTFGNLQISTAQSKFGGASIAFNGNSYLIAETSSANFSTEPFTVELWVYFNSTNASTTPIVNTYINSNTGWSFSLSNRLLCAAFSGNGIDISTTFQPSLATWYHIAMSGQAGASGIRIFVDGIQQGNTYTGAVNFGERALAVGAVTSLRLNGYIDDLRITKGVARYTSNFTPPTAPFPDA